MKKLVLLLALGVVTLGAGTAAAQGPSSEAKCDLLKSKAAGRFYLTCMICQAKSVADVEFDIGACIDRAREKCAKAIDHADDVFEEECKSGDNGEALCGTVEEQCGNLHGEI